MTGMNCRYFQFTWVEVEVRLDVNQARADLSDPAGQEGQEFWSAGHTGVDVDCPGLARAHQQAEAQEES